MTTYKGIAIDGTIITNTADVDRHLEAITVAAYKDACWLFNKTRDYATAAFADEKAHQLVTQYGYTWEQVEALELAAIA